MTAHQQNADGTWSPAQPIPPHGPIARLEAWARRRGHRRIAQILGRIDERGLG